MAESIIGLPQGTDPALSARGKFYAHLLLTSAEKSTLFCSYLVSIVIRIFENRSWVSQGNGGPAFASTKSGQRIKNRARLAVPVWRQVLRSVSTRQYLQVSILIQQSLYACWRKKSSASCVWRQTVTARRVRFICSSN